MKYLDLDQYSCQVKSLTALGFHPQASGYSRLYSIRQGAYTCQVHITKASLFVNVYDALTHEEYLPFYVKHHQGAFVTEIRAEVGQLVEQLLNQCFIKNAAKELLLAYARDYFHTIPVFPWENIDHCVLKSANRQKWYAIFMHIPYEVLGIERKGKVDIVNVKGDPQMIIQCIDRCHYFPAYHMNKKYWMSILLDAETDIDRVKQMLRESYLLVERNNDKANKGIKKQNSKV